MATSGIAGDLLDNARNGDRRALARLISCIERGEPAADPPRRRCGPIGGPVHWYHRCPRRRQVHPGQRAHRRPAAERDRAAVLAVDPSSPISRGALLGDRVRMHRHATSPKVFIRSMATRQHHGGTGRCDPGNPPRLLQHCGWPLVLIETVGVGQVELDVVNTADIAVVVLNPGWGDEIQANKAGLMEIADVFVINKADRPGLESTRRDIDAVLINRPKSERPPVIETVATEGVGIDELAAAIRSVEQQLRSRDLLVRRRKNQLRMELGQQLERRLQRALTVQESGDMYAQLIEQLASGACTTEQASDQIIRELLRTLGNEGETAA
jgi:LAO/AO transport system kinase